MHVFLKWVMQGRIVMNDQTVGFVLKEVPYQEKAVIVSLLTKEGKISFIAKGIRNINSKNAAALQLFTKVEVEYDHREGKELQVLKRAKPLCFYRHVYSDLQISSMASVLVDIVDRLVVLNEDTSNLYTLIEKSFDLWESNEKANMIFVLSLSTLLQEFGFEPNMDACVHCGKQEVVSFSSKEGGFLCADHAQELRNPMMKVNQLKTLRMAFKARLEHYDLLKNKIDFGHQEIHFALDLFRQHAGLSLKSFDFYEHLFM